MEAQAIVGEPFGVGADRAEPAGRDAARTPGTGRRGREREIGPGILSGPADAGPGKCLEGVSRRGQPADQRRPGATGGRRHLAGNPQPSAANDPLFPLSRHGALGSHAPGPATDPAGRSSRGTIRPRTAACSRPGGATMPPRAASCSKSPTFLPRSKPTSSTRWPGD